jgi:hypothetical protein
MWLDRIAAEICRWWLRHKSEEARAEKRRHMLHDTQEAL